MKTIMFRLLAIVSGVFVMVSCSAVSKYMRMTAVDVSFERLDRHTDEYVGETVILGGYIQEIREETGKTRMVVLQAPLGVADQPKAEDKSQGKFFVLYDGFLDESEYGVGQDITVAGPILGRKVPEIGNVSAPLLTMKALEIHLWSYFGEEDEDDECLGYDPLIDSLPEIDAPPRGMND